ncbi:PER1 [Verticillium alfalfae VaMs.102]|uniref:Post-GPI attachment to proteins factor 3 n=1 Tax=Verticillium alfalfae (strain VaMs.102 / ATCC MYA-4576 / FGSC 10136) TaxID=526221 RepID=C9SMA8_VERA1|nr:PER1 [Verticillium alfalfae VaMs.102]EEY19923.1 PER1 [Verticillium alfalfae VaMs.102]
MIRSSARAWLSPLLCSIALLLLFAVVVDASVGDRLPDFRECVEVCKQENCLNSNPTPIPLHRRLLFWTCSSECDYTCQHIITNRRVDRALPIVQFHGKWPFQRLLGMQEPASVLFSLGNLVAHRNGLRKLRAAIPTAYPLHPFYVLLAQVGIVSWVFSAVFHTRDSTATEQLDYFAAGASVLYGLYYTVVRIFRLYRATPRRPQRPARLVPALRPPLRRPRRYLKGVAWDYTYNMAANVAVGMVQNALWVWYSYSKYRETKRAWAVWPGLVVASVITVMSLELFDFAPVWGALDAHSLWHLGTIAPTVLWYNFLIKDAQDDMAGTERLKG